MTRLWSRWASPNLHTLPAEHLRHAQLSVFVFDLREDVTLRGKNSLLEITRGLLEVSGLAQVAPIIVIGAKRHYFFSASDQTQISIDDGKNPFFVHQR